MLEPVFEHPWDLAPKDAIVLQNELADRIRFERAPDPIQLVAGVDVSMKEGLARAAVVIFSFPDLQEVERVRAEAPITYPYVPGLLTFREAPVILQAMKELEHTPKVLIFDGQGYAHPRRLGLATHIGILLDHPTVGCAKSRLCGTYDEPDVQRGACTLLYDDDAVIGAVLRTRTHVKPVFVSVGHRMTLEESINLVLACGKGYRLPEPTRWAHRAALEKE